MKGLYSYLIVSFLFFKQIDSSCFWYDLCSLVYLLNTHNLDLNNNRVEIPDLILRISIVFSLSFPILKDEYSLDSVVPISICIDPVSTSYDFESCF